MNKTRCREVLEQMLYEEECNCGWVTDDDEEEYKEKIGALKYAIKTLKEGR